MSSTNILIIKFRSIGDIVTMTPCLDAILDTHHNAEIDIAVEKPHNQLLAFDPRVKELLVLEKKGVTLFERLKENIEYIQLIRKKRYDIVIDLHGGPRSAWATFFSRSKKKIGSTLYRHSFPYTDVLSPYREDPPVGRYHIVLTQIGILEKLGMNAENPHVRIYVSPEAVEKANRLIDDIRNEHKLVVVQPTATGYNKRWHDAQWSYYLNELYNRMNINIVFTSGPGECGYVDDIIKRLKVPYTNLSGKTDIQTLAALIKGADLFIGCDSGPGHIAAALGTPAIILFCSTFDEIWAPWGEKIKIIRADIPCSPCGKRKCYTGTLDCIEKLHPDYVLKQTEDFIHKILD